MTDVVEDVATKMIIEEKVATIATRVVTVGTETTVEDTIGSAMTITGDDATAKKGEGEGQGRRQAPDPNPPLGPFQGQGLDLPLYLDLHRDHLRE